MTPDQAIALSLVRDLPRRALTDRLRADDPTLLELADRHRGAAVRARTDAAGTGITAIPWMDPAFPPLLRTLPDCPPALWVRGAPGSLATVLASPAIAIVGSRAATPLAQEIAAEFAADLAARGVTVVSGLARGVDSAAHRGALTAGRTIAVLGSGPDRIYPREHTGLADDIAVAGAVLTEHPPGTAPLPFHFPLRNRLISGLSQAVVVVEASRDSGSLITAAWALEQGRDVMAAPGNPLTDRNRGGHQLIKDGATLVESADDILIELGWNAPGSTSPSLFDGAAPADAAAPVAAPVSADEAGRLLARMERGQAYDAGALAVRSGLPMAGVLALLLELELRGEVVRVGGGRFLRSRRPC